jgi:ketosteroid isomerase-like protein
MSGLADPAQFARHWNEAWNAHDVDAVLELFHDDVVFTSPLAARLFPESGGVIEGKDALRQYWSTALAERPDLRFELTGIQAGIDTLLIQFRHPGQAERIDVLRLRDGRVFEGHGTYPVPLDNQT